MPACAFCEESLPENTTTAACSTECFDAWDVVVAVADPTLRQYVIGKALNLILGQFEGEDDKLIPGTTADQIENRISNALQVIHERGHVHSGYVVMASIAKDMTDAAVTVVYFESNDDNTRRRWRMYLGDNAAQIAALS